MKKPSPLFCTLGVLWSLPLTLVGVALALVYLPKSIRWRDGCIEVVQAWIFGNPGAQTWGIIECCASVDDRDNPVRVRLCGRRYGGLRLWQISAVALRWIGQVCYMPKNSFRHR